MSENKEQTLDERIKHVREQIISNGKDARWTKNMISELLSLQRQKDVEPMELCVPTEEVKEVADADSFKVIKTVRGYLFQTRRGALSTFVDAKNGTVCSMLETLMNLIWKADKEEYEQAYLDCISYVMQAPLFAAMGLSLPAYGKLADHEPLFNIGIAILKEFNRFNEKYFIDAEVHKDTEEDVAENNAMENASDALGMIAQE